MALDRRLMLTALAIVAGALVGAALFVPGGPFGAFAPKTGIFVHVENTGGGDLSVRVEVRDDANQLVVANAFRAPAHSGTEKSVVNLAHGKYIVVATFTNGGATATGRATLDTRECGEGSLAIARYDVGSDGGVSLTPATTSCRG